MAELIELAEIFGVLSVVLNTKNVCVKRYSPQPCEGE